MSEMDKYYQIMGLNPGASEKEIVEAYKVLVKVWHPDRFSDEPNIQKNVTAKIKEIDEAFKQLLVWAGSFREKERETPEPNLQVRTEPSETKGSLVIQTEPEDAVIVINEQPVGMGCYERRDLPVGSYKVWVIKEGYEIWEQEIDIRVGAREEIVAKLKLKEPESEEVWKDPYLGMEFVYVKGGYFEMGDTFGDGVKMGKYDEKPVHEVHVDDFYIGKYLVTQGEWKKLMAENPSHFLYGDNCPVEGVNWRDAQEFIKKLTKLTGEKYRLPTEAEWEYAARSGGKSEKWAGTSIDSKLQEYAYYKLNSDGRTHPVGQKKPNGLELYDMTGNVWEWMQDWYGREYYDDSPKNNPQGAENGVGRVLRGGAICSLPLELRVTNRKPCEPEERRSEIGFRLVLSAKDTSAEVIETYETQQKDIFQSVTESHASQPDHTHLGPKSYVSPRPTVHKDEGPANGQSVKPPQGGLGVGTKTGLTVTGPSGVGGWLLLLVIGMMVLGPLLGAGRIGVNILDVEHQYPQLVSLDQWKTYKSATWWTFLGFAAISFYGGLGLARGKDWSVVTRAKAILWITGPVLSIVMDVWIPILILGEGVAGNPQFIGAFLMSAIAAGIWTAYLSKSKRVQTTYDRTA